MADKAEGVFLRNSTGLVRTISPWNIFLINIGEIGFGTGLITLNEADSFLPNGNPGGYVTLAILLMTFVVLFEAYIYYFIVKSVGRTAGDYVWVSRTLGPVLGGLLIFGFTFTGFPFIAIVLNWMITLSLAPSISTIAVATGSSSLLSMTSFMMSTGFLIAFSFIMLIILLLIDIFYPKYGFLILGIIVLIALIGTFMMVIPYLALGSAGSISSINSFLSSYNSSYYSIASQYKGPVISWPAILLLLPFTAYALPWINNAADFSGELKNLKRAAWMGTIFAASFSGIFLALFQQIYYNMLGFNFATQAMLSWPSSLSGMGVVPNMLTVATILFRSNPAYIWIMNIAFSFWYLASVQQTILSISRYVFGMSFDRLLPSWFAAVSERFHSPVNSLAITGILGAIMIIITSYTNWLYLYSTTALGMVFFAFVGITAIIYGIKRKSEAGSHSLPLVISGIIVAIGFAYLSYQFLFLPYYGINTLSWGLMLFFWIMGALLYPISKWYYGKKGLDVSMIFKEIPPE
ncbi:MAG: APC family permease [Nitrososphaeria archaeon]|jgi:hypothetical protein